MPHARRCFCDGQGVSCSAALRRPSSWFAALGADDGKDKAAAEETGLVGPAAQRQSDDESRELEERLKTLRLELASELQVPR